MSGGMNRLSDKTLDALAREAVEREQSVAEYQQRYRLALRKARGDAEPPRFTRTLGDEVQADRLITNVCESPIEAMLFVAFLTQARRVDGAWTCLGGGSASDSASDSDGIAWCAGARVHALYLQRGVGSYRCDFLLEVYQKSAEPMCRLIIECDGFAYHHATPELVAADYRRDRELIREGYTVLRFAGLEVRRDAASCVQQVLEIAERTAERAT